MLGLGLSLALLAGGLRLMLLQLDLLHRAALARQLDQDLRAASELIVRELRRAGHWQAALDGGTASNPNTALLLGGSPGSATLAYAYDEGGAVQRRMLRLNSGVLQLQLSPGSSFQALTDPASTRVLSLGLSLDSADQAVHVVCGPDTLATVPRQQRALSLLLQAESPADPSIRREVRARPRLRNDRLPAPPCLG